VLAVFIILSSGAKLKSSPLVVPIKNLDLFFPPWPGRQAKDYTWRHKQQEQNANENFLGLFLLKENSHSEFLLYAVLD
jgi:hypothetical protein